MTTAPKNVSRRIFSGTIAGWMQTAVATLVYVIQTKVLFSFLDSEVMGIWFLFLSISGYIAFLDLGVSPTLSREIGFLQGRSSSQEEIQQRIADLIATSTRLLQCISVVVLVLGLAGGLLFLEQATSAHSNEITLAWVIFLAGASVNLWGGASLSALYGLGSISTERWIRTFVSLFWLLSSALALWLGYGLVGLCATWVLQGLLLRFTGWRFLYQQYRWIQELKGCVQWHLTRSLILPSLKWAAMVLGSLLILETDNVVIASALGVAAIPAYALVAKLVKTALGLSLLVVTSSTPFISRAHAEGDLAQITVLLDRNVRLGMGVMGLFVSILLIFGDWLIQAWVGPGHFVGYGVLLVFLVMLTLEAHHVIHATALMATGRLVFHWMALGAGILNLVFSLLLVGPLGLLGVSLGTLMAQILTNNWYAPYITLREFKIPPNEYLRHSLKPVAVLFISYGISFCALRAGLELIPSTSLSLRVLIALSACGVIGMCLLYALLLRASERHFIISSLNRYFERGKQVAES